MTRDEFTAGYLARQQAIESTEFDDAKHESATLDLADFLFDAFGTATGQSSPREIPDALPIGGMVACTHPPGFHESIIARNMRRE